MKKSLWISGLLTTMTAVHTHAEVTDTNATKNLFPDNYQFTLPARAPTYTTFLSKFVSEFGTPDTFVNHLGSPSMFQWATIYERGTVNYIEAINAAGQRSFEDAANYGLREAAISYFPVEEYESYAEATGISLLHGIIGNTAEEQRSMISAIPNASEYSWWRQARADGAYDYGLRPFNSSSYLYGHVRVGHYAGQPFATISGRWYYDVKHSSDHMAIESTFNMPRNYGFQVGTSFDPFKATDSQQTSFSFRLQHFESDSIIKSWSIGLQQNNHTTLVAQLDWAW